MVGRDREREREIYVKTEAEIVCSSLEHGVRTDEIGKWDTFYVVVTVVSVPVCMFVNLYVSDIFFS